MTVWSRWSRPLYGKKFPQGLDEIVQFAIQHSLGKRTLVVDPLLQGFLPKLEQPDGYWTE